MNCTRWIPLSWVGIVVVLLTAGCATKGESPASFTEAGSQSPTAQTAQEEETAGDASSGVGEPTLAELDAALLFLGGVALVETAGKGDLDGVKALLEDNADVNGKDKTGTTALMAAAAKGHAEICRVLLEAGADAGLKNKDGKSAADLAGEAGFEDVRVLVTKTPD